VRNTTPAAISAGAVARGACWVRLRLGEGPAFGFMSVSIDPAAARFDGDAALAEVARAPVGVADDGAFLAA